LASLNFPSSAVVASFAVMPMSSDAVLMH
jgi:hypothetical protein